MIYDFHTHSNNSFDSKEKLEDMCSSAIEKGITHIGFTEHFCLNSIRKTYGYMNFDRFSRDTLEAKTKFSKQLNIYKGIEICEPHLMNDDYKDALESLNIDMILGSVHNIRNMGLRNLIKTYDYKKAYELYFQEVYDMVKNADFDIAAHIDLLNRYAYKTIGTYDFKDNIEMIEEIFKLIIKREKGIEINTSVFRGREDNMENSLKLIKLYKSLGGEIITVGSDAHKAEDVGQYCKESLKIISELGFKYIFTFEERHAIGNRIV